MKNLLICIAFHYSPERGVWLNRVLDNIRREYKDICDIIIDTNDHHAVKEFDGVYGSKWVLHTNLNHPFHLTWCHRQHIKDNIDKYENFMYVEDDMWVPYANYLRYLENFNILWPNWVPSFIRIEEVNGKQVVSDVHKKLPSHRIKIAGRTFDSLPFLANYHAFWIMPRKELKETMKSDFVKYTVGREFAASYVAWELEKHTMLEIENGFISHKCYSYHLPNNYAISGNATLKPEQIYE